MYLRYQRFAKCDTKKQHTVRPGGLQNSGKWFHIERPACGRFTQKTLCSITCSNTDSAVKKWSDRKRSEVRGNRCQSSSCFKNTAASLRFEFSNVRCELYFKEVLSYRFALKAVQHSVEPQRQSKLHFKASQRDFHRRADILVAFGRYFPVVRCGYKAQYKHWSTGCTHNTVWKATVIHLLSECWVFSCSCYCCSGLLCMF